MLRVMSQKHEHVDIDAGQLCKRQLCSSGPPWPMLDAYDI